VEIAEPSNYNFILRFEIDKMLVRFAQMGIRGAIIGDDVVGTAHVRQPPRLSGQGETGPQTIAMPRILNRLELYPPQ
jgi:hypothetical protein